MKGFRVVRSLMSVNSVGEVLFPPVLFEYMNELTLERSLINAISVVRFLALTVLFIAMQELTVE